MRDDDLALDYRDRAAIEKVIQQDIIDEIGNRLKGVRKENREEDLKFEEIEASPRKKHNDSIRMSHADPVDAENGLSYTKMIKVVEPRHPRHLVNGRLQPHKYGETKFGWHCACRSWRKSDIEYMGVGITAYFKLLKFMTILFLWFSILSVPAFMFYISGNYSAV